MFGYDEQPRVRVTAAPVIAVAVLSLLAACDKSPAPEEPPQEAVVGPRPGWKPYDESLMANACDVAAKARLPDPASFQPAYGWKAGGGGAADEAMVKRDFKATAGGELVSSNYTCVFDTARKSVRSISLGAPFS